MEIRRDRYGVPYIFGATDAECLFGLGYAQAQDGFRYVEDCFLRAVGRGAEVHGAEALADDRMARALEIPKLAIAEYRRSPPHMQRLYRAFHAGLERYAADAGVAPDRLGRFEPWHCLALLRFKYYVQEFLGYAGLSETDQASGAPLERPNGSNAWAIAPSRSKSGNAMLLINPHVGFFGIARYYECTLHSDEGLRFQGITRYGFPIPYMGHNDRLGWAHTDNYPDNGDLYAEDIRPAGDGHVYRYGSELRPLREWRETVKVRGPRGAIEERAEKFAATHHGPIVGKRDGKPLAARLARLDDGGWFDQWYAMCRARSLAEFRAACSRCAVAYMNIVYADRDGNILHIYGGAVPRRSSSFDWSKPVDGADPRTEWNGYHALDELPQTLNPASGYVQNCNSTPFTAAGPAKGDEAANYPRYMIGPEGDNLRAQRSRAILDGTRKFGFEEWARAATDTGIHAAAAGVREIADAWKALPAGPRRIALGPLVDQLRAWDGVATIDSVPTTLFVRWFSRRSRDQGNVGPGEILQWLEQARDEVIALRGKWEVPWGEINRLQRVPWDSALKFDDRRPSLPVPGAPGWLGIVFNFYTNPPEGTDRRYGGLGNSYVSVVEFGAIPTAASVMVFGQTMDPSSPHYDDQSKLYAQGAFKPGWWSRGDISGNTRATRSLGSPKA